MCVNYVHYFPRINLEVCKSSVSWQALRNYFKFANEYVNRRKSETRRISRCQSVSNFNLSAFTTQVGQAADESVERSVGQLSRGRVDSIEGANSARLLFGGADIDAVQSVERRAIPRQLGGTAFAWISSPFGGSVTERDPLPITRRIRPRLKRDSRFEVVMA